MQQYPAMDCLRPIVDPVYHRLIFSGQPDISGLLANKSGSGKILNGPPNLLNSSDNNDSADLMVCFVKNVVSGLIIHGFNFLLSIRIRQKTRHTFSTQTI